MDVTNFFRETAEKFLGKGEMVHDHSFSLYHTMTALEAGDPKMDITFDGNVVLSPQQRLNNGTLKIDNFTNSELLAIMRQLFIIEVKILFVTIHFLFQIS